MSAKSLKTTTAVLAALSLLQPLPALAQTAPAVTGSAAAEWDKPLADSTLRAFEPVCGAVQITEALACEAYLVKAQASVDAAAAADAAAETARLAAEAAAKADADADTVAKAAAAAEAAAKAEADADAAAKAEADAAAKAASDAAADAAAKAEADAAADADATAAADAAAKAEADAAAKVQADADAAAKTDADVTARIKADAEAAEKAAADAAAKAAADAKATTADAPVATEAATPIPAPELCAATTIAADGTVTCVETLTPDSIAAIATEEGTTAPDVAVTTETVTESTRRSSGEEFRDAAKDAPAAGAAATTTAEVGTAAPATGMTDLEKAGLFVLGAVVVGAILSNGQRVEANTGDRVVVVDDAGAFRVLKDDDALLRQPGSEVRTERFTDGSTRTTVNRDDGTRIVTIRDSSGRALRRTRFEPDGRSVILIDDTRTFEPVVVRDLPKPEYANYDYRAASDDASLRAAMLAADQRDLGRSFSLRQVRDIVEVRELSPEINLEAITFATNSAALQATQAEQLAQMGRLMRDVILANPAELFLIEGHTDAVGQAGSNLLLSDRRAESVALALTEYFQVPSENMIVQGYGESFLKIPTAEAERLNRRVAVRRITPLVQ